LNLIIILCSHDLRYFAWCLPTLIDIMILKQWKTLKQALSANKINGRDTKEDSHSYNYQIVTKPFTSLSPAVSKIFCEMQWSCFHPIALWWNQSWWSKRWPTGPSEGLYVQNDYFSDHFSKGYYVTSKHTYKRHIF